MSKSPQLLAGDAAGAGNDTDAAAGGADDDDIPEVMLIEGDYSYLEPVLRVIAILHTLVSFSMLVAYYCLKVPLVIFKREKEIARQLEFDGLYIAEQPGDDDVKGHWDKLVLSTQSFPESYWDKFVKKKVSEGSLRLISDHMIWGLCDGFEEDCNDTLHHDTICVMIWYAI